MKMIQKKRSKRTGRKMYGKIEEWLAKKTDAWMRDVMKDLFNELYMKQNNLSTAK